MVETISKLFEFNTDSSVRPPMSAVDSFMRFVARDSSGNVDVSGMLSHACYKTWLDSRWKTPQDPKEAFRKTLTGHCEYLTPHVLSTCCNF